MKNLLPSHTIIFTSLLFVIIVTSGCVNRFFYFPNGIEYRKPEAMTSPVEEMNFKSSDGTKLHAWFMHSTASNTLGTVVHFHGNAQNLTAHSSLVDWLPSEGFNVFIFDYRGYGKSAGKPSRKGLYQDGVAALEFVRTLPMVDTNRVIILGQSLGGATALAVAARNPDLAGQAIIIDSSFYSYRRIVRDKIGAIPILAFLRVPLSYLVISDAYSPSSKLDDISPTPLLFMHGTADVVIPVHHAHLLYKRAKDPKELLIIEGGNHISGLVLQRGTVAPLILTFMTNALVEKATTATHE